MPIRLHEYTFDNIFEFILYLQTTVGKTRDLYFRPRIASRDVEISSNFFDFRFLFDFIILLLFSHRDPPVRHPLWHIRSALCPFHPVRAQFGSIAFPPCAARALWCSLPP